MCYFLYVSFFWISSFLFCILVSQYIFFVGGKWVTYFASKTCVLQLDQIERQFFHFCTEWFSFNVTEDNFPQNEILQKVEGFRSTNRPVFLCRYFRTVISIKCPELYFFEKYHRENGYWIMFLKGKKNGTKFWS